MSQLEPIMAEEKVNAPPPACASLQSVIAPPTPVASPLSSPPPVCLPPQSPIPPLALSSPLSLATTGKEVDAKDDVLEGPSPRQHRRRHRPLPSSSSLSSADILSRHFRFSLVDDDRDDEGQGARRLPPPSSSPATPPPQIQRTPRHPCFIFAILGELASFDDDDDERHDHAKAITLANLSWITR